MILDENKTYSRIAGIIYHDGGPVVKLDRHFPDYEKLSVTAIQYMNRYMEMWPNLYQTMGEFQANADWQKRQDDKNTKGKIVKMFFDLETTGVDVKKHSIHQISGCFEVNGDVVEYFNFNVAPHPKAKIEPEAMKIANVTEEQIKAYPPMGEVYKQFTQMLAKYCYRYDKKDKMYLVGFNNRSFDDNFLRAWFEQNKDTFFGAWFWTDSLDVLVLASQYLIDRRVNMENFKLMTVARELGIMVDESKLHDATYDIYLTREIYRIVTGLEMEL